MRGITPTHGVENAAHDGAKLVVMGASYHNLVSSRYNV